MPFKFARKHRLKSKKAITQLFEKGKRIHVPSMTLVYNKEVERVDPCFQISFSVPKRKMKRAVDRNRIKRLMRASFRSKIPSLIQDIEGCGSTYNLMIIYQNYRHEPFKAIDDKILLLLKRFIDQIDPLAKD